MNTFSVGGAISFGWETFKKRAWFFVGLTLVILILTWLIGVITQYLNDTVLTGVGTVVSMLVQTFVDLGATAILLKAHDSLESVKIQDLWHPRQYVIYFIATLLAGAAIMLGMILLIIPGIIVATMLMFVKFIVVDRNLGPIEALKESARITKGHRMDLFLLLLAVIGINLVGLIALGIGLLVAIPVSGLAMVHAYRLLEHTASEVVAA
jgi:uncharacterized membrane protein